jgi:hypothetical protein
MKTIHDIVLFQQRSPAVHETSAEPEKLISGSGAQTVQNFYTDGSRQFHTGIWSGDVGAWKVRYSEHEFCTMLEGRVRVSDYTGASVELTPGDHFVIPAGFEGVWSVLEPARKLYVVFDARS